MKILNRLLGKTVRSSAVAAIPAAQKVDLSPLSGSVTLAAPVSGRLVELTEVPDPVFAAKVLGDGFAIDPADDRLVAPFDGLVIKLQATNHAIILRARNGAEVLLHIGIDTVGLNGEGFRAMVRENEAVRQGQILITFDRKKIAPRVPSMMIPVILTNEGFTFTAVTSSEVNEGSPVLELRPAGMAEANESVIPAESFGIDAVLIDPFGLHARPSGVIAQYAKASLVPVSISLHDKVADARSPVALMTLGAKQGDRLHISAASATPSAPATPAPARVALLAPGEAARISAVAAVPGIAIGTTMQLVQSELTFSETAADPGQEADLLDRALASVRDMITREMAGQHQSQAAILEAHLAFLDDPGLRHVAMALIAGGKSAAYSWKSAIDSQITALRTTRTAILIERASDLQDIQRRVIRVLTGAADEHIGLGDATVLFAQDLLPSQFAALDHKRLAGICLAASGPTAHIAILAAAHAIPMVVAAGEAALAIPDAQPVILDAQNGLVSVNPPAGELEQIESRVESRRLRLETSRADAAAICHMQDGTRIEVVANLGSLADVAPALQAGAEGCGLLRTEFLYLDRDQAPSEEEQYQQYQSIADALQDRPLIIRTLDAGADKDVPYVELPADENPALGLRGIRMSLWQPALLRAQIRAILRVKSTAGVKLLLPMIATIEDLRRVRAVVDAESAALGRETPISLGVMVEVPSVALTSACFAAEVDFFSIGTNDLTQYALAMDRCNPRLAAQLDPFHPAVLHLIALTCQGAATHGRWVGVCGNLAASPLAAPVLIGLGVSELSASASALPEIKSLVRSLDMSTCRSIAQEALTFESAEAVRALLDRRFPGY
jgi:phosphoenolpyruvate-protein phosphotransferase